MKALVFEVWDLMVCETRLSSKLPESSKIRLDTGKSKTPIKRPHLDAFLKRMAELFVLIPYTTRSRGVTDKVLDALEPDEHRFSHRFFLDSCGNGIHGKTKDLRILQWPMDQVIAVDDSCSKYDSHSDNVVIIPTFNRTDLRKDRVLLDLMPFLEGLAKREVEDVRPAIRARFFENFPVAKKGNRKRMFEMVLEKNVRPVETVLVDDPPIEDKNVVDLDPDEETNVVDPDEAMETKVSNLVEAMETKVSDQDEMEEMETKVSDQEMETKVNDQDEPVETKASDREEPVEERVKKVRWLIPEMEKNREEPVEEMEKVAKKETGRNEQPSERGRIKALARALLKVLRQPVLHPNLEMRPDGFCKLKELLELDFMTKSGVPLSSHTAAEAIKAVDKLTKKLAKMVDETGALYIGAPQEPVPPDGTGGDHEEWPHGSELEPDVSGDGSAGRGDRE
ncbi:hypothetical protein SELMODRAFT_424529 [Selaginella moellendorffii]|uniref:Mitochondrial import inner membrane translocase subunit TIM50 n=1 Tax=Selaginella moellendorffii TaxID=88036 RepID=D8SQ72_SELML|nr:hypothetical protein SELMODRAFT_424529 [Selaginella moellendorffii]